MENYGDQLPKKTPTELLDDNSHATYLLWKENRPSPEASLANWFLMWGLQSDKQKLWQRRRTKWFHRWGLQNDNQKLWQRDITNWFLKSLLEHDDASDERSPEGCSQCSRKAHQMHQSDDSRHPHGSLLAFLFLHYFSQLHRVQNQPCCRTRHHHSQVCKPPHHSTKPNLKSPTKFSEVLPTNLPNPQPHLLSNFTTYWAPNVCVITKWAMANSAQGLKDKSDLPRMILFTHTHNPISSTHTRANLTQICNPKMAMANSAKGLKEESVWPRKFFQLIPVFQLLPASHALNN